MIDFLNHLCSNDIESTIVDVFSDNSQRPIDQHTITDSNDQSSHDFPILPLTKLLGEQKESKTTPVEVSSDEAEKQNRAKERKSRAKVTGAKLRLKNSRKEKEKAEASSSKNKPKRHSKGEQPITSQAQARVSVSLCLNYVYVYLLSPASLLLP